MIDAHQDLTSDRLRAILQDAHLNFLIGAGTPSAYFALLGDVEKASTTIDAAAGHAPGAKAIARASVQAYFFDHVVAPNIPLLQCTDAALEVLRSYGEFGRTMNRLLISRRNSLLNKKINLFTTNVDLVFELAFERLGIDLIDGFAGRIRPVYDLGLLGSLHYRSGVRYEHRSEAPTFDLYKLHGSIGWQLTDDPAAPSGIVFDRDLTDVTRVATLLDGLRAGLLPISDPTQVDAGLLLASAAGREVPAGLDDLASAYDRLVIVNPEKQKFATTVLTETYYELIRRFANELERENSVLFVHGFSFRDEHIRKLVIRCARANPTLHIVVFCHGVQDRGTYDALIPQEQVPNSNVVYVTPHDAEDKLVLDEVVRRYFAPLATAASSASDRIIDAVLPDPTRGAADD